MARAPQGEDVIVSGQIASQPLLRAEGVVKRFPGVVALAGAFFDIRWGEIHALLGANGAGKSTLMKILSGVHTADQGSVIFRGQSVRFANTTQAQRAGISIVHQELSLIPSLTVAENIFLGNERRLRGPLGKAGFTDERTMITRSRAFLESVGLSIDPRTPVGALSLAQRQLIEIAKAVSLQAHLLIMDEPTSSLTEREVRVLFRLMKQLKNDGMGIIFITHRLGEALAIADRITVLRNGATVETVEAAGCTQANLIRMMVGRDVTIPQTEDTSGDGLPILRVNKLSNEHLNDVSFSLHRGEILGFGGLVGAGRTETMRALFGVDPIQSGTIHIKGRKVTIGSPQDAIRHGIGFVTEDRKTQGLLLDMFISENITLPNLRRFFPFFLRNNEEEAIAQQFADRLAIRTPSLQQRVKFLSGGNQQKVVLAKWLALKPKILILDEATRGVDIGAKSEIHHLVRSLADQGISILLVSSEMEELLSLSHRICVMSNGRVRGILNRAEATEEAVLELAVPESKITEVV